MEEKEYDVSQEVYRWSVGKILYLVSYSKKQVLDTDPLGSEE